jgi:hypothetical protein
VPVKPVGRGPLNDRCVIAPYSVLNTRDGFWQGRKRGWLGLGIESELGRDTKTYNAEIFKYVGRAGAMSNTSIFDPVLCEIIYRWWATPGDVVLDPFAGGSVRGVVASCMGLRYAGVELRAEQVEANRASIAAHPEQVGKYPPRWMVGDSAQVVPGAPMADLLFSCPPYGGLEVYSDDPADISNRTYPEFLAGYGDIITKALGRLRPDRFAAWVVGNYRDKATGRMLDLVGDTVRAFEAAGATFWNDAIIVNAPGSAYLRAGGTFGRGSRKLVKLHQNLLVFCKGNPKAAAARLPEYQTLADYGDE